MKNRKKLAGIIAATVSVVLSGCSLAVPNAGEEGGKDRLIGAFITSESLDLFDIDAYVEDHAFQLAQKEEITVTNGGKYEGKLYATIDKSGGEEPSDWKISFDDIEGIRMFSPIWEDEDGGTCWGSVGDDGICDMKINTDISDNTKEITISGTVYMLQGQMDKDIGYYTNPVYQTPDGKIYAVSGSGFSTSGESGEGMHMAVTLSDEVTMNENGKSKTEKSNVTVSHNTMYEPVKITLYQMADDHKIIKETEYIPGKLPERIFVEKETEYILIETEKKTLSGKPVIDREIYDDKEEENTLGTYYVMDNGIIAKQETEVVNLGD